MPGILFYRIRILRVAIVCLFILASFSSAYAQLSVADTTTTIKQLQTLFGAGVTISNLTTVCDTNLAMGQFNGISSNLSLSTGVILSTGKITDAPGPNNLGSTSTDLFKPGDASLNALIPGFTTYDACVIEFDIVPLCDTIAIKYVFGSEEYPEFVFSSFNDVFAFFISGPGITGTQNIALVPGTPIPVTIDNVNNVVNSQYYVNNVGGTSVEYDGFTVPLLASSAVIPCQTYHIKIAIADAGDGIYDSAVFLEAGGIGCTGQLLTISSGNTLNFGGNVAVEGCVDGYFQFTVPLANIVDDTFHFQIAGTATPGLDYIPIPDSVIMPAGQTTVNIPVTVISDGIVEGQEFITLIYVDSVLCSSTFITDTVEIVILDPPTSYAGPDELLCSGDTIQIGVPSITGLTYQWMQTSGLSDPTIPDPDLTLTNNTGSPVVYQYILTTTALLGGCESNDTILVTVDDIDADFNADTVCQGNPTTFVNLSTGTPGTTYVWDFGDGTNSPVPDPVHLYGAGTTYSAQLIASTALGCVDTLVQNVIVHPLPVVGFTAAPVCLGAATTFANTSNIGTAWQWDFGDGNSSALQNPTHTYATSGTYQAQLIVTTADGCLDSLTQTIEVFEPPVAAFSADSACLTYAIHFDDLSQNGSGTIGAYSWDFGDGNSSSLQNPNHTYLSFGNFNVSLLVTDNHGCTASGTQAVTVFPPVNSDFSFNPVCFGDTTHFQDQSITQPGSPSVLWQWDFGDGTGSTLSNPDHFYATYGSYTTQLIVSTINGCVDSLSQTVQVYDQPAAGFSYESRCDGAAIPFTNLSQYNNSNVNWSWNFGDGSSGSQANPSHLFPAFGTYPVSLTITNNNGCTDTYNSDVVVWPVPDAVFAAADVCFGEALFINNQSVVAPPGQIVSYAWDFGDGKTSPQPQPAHIYTTPGIYTVSLEVETQHGCRDMLSQVIRVFPLPGVQFEKTDVCLGDTSRFSDQSFVDGSLTGDALAAWNWDFGDGMSSSQQNPVHVYGQPGIYTVTLRVLTNNGCEKSREKKVEVYAPPPVPEIGNDTVCFGDAAYLTANASQDVDVLWFESPGATTPFHTGYSFVTPLLPYEQSWYVQSVQKTMGCKSIKVPVTAFLFSDLNAKIVTSATQAEIPSATVSFQVQSANPLYSYEWSFGDGSVSAEASPVHTWMTPGKYVVRVRITDIYGCERTLEEVIEVKEVISLFVPSAFTPNGDGVNDEFQIGHALLEDLHIQVYNRWGVLVYESEDLDFRWTGNKLDGGPVPEGVYVYFINARDIHQKDIKKTGTITLIR